MSKMQNHGLHKCYILHFPVSTSLEIPKFKEQGHIRNLWKKTTEFKDIYFGAKLLEIYMELLE